MIRILCLIFSLFMGASLYGETTLTIKTGNKTLTTTAPEFPLQGGCRGIRSDSRGDGAYHSFNDSRSHSGVDWYAPLGTKIVSPWPGRVEASKPNGSGGAGGFIQIKHTNGLVTKYAHLQRRLVRTGETVVAGQIIGEVGKTGNARNSRTHPHLHFALLNSRMNNLNPHPYFGCKSYAANATRMSYENQCTTTTNCQ